MTRSRTAVRLAAATLTVTLFVILWGAWVRASGSGAGCGNHWPTCNGVIIPQSPGMHTLVEFTHRASTGIAFGLIVALLAVCWRRFAPGHPARRAAAIALVLFFVEAGIGAGLVKFELVAANASLARAISLGIHLVNTQLLLSAIALAGWWSAGHPPIEASLWKQRGGWFVLAFGGLIVVGMAGAFASLGDTLYPAATLSAGFAQDRAPTANLLLHIRVWHPVLAVLVGAGLLVLANRASHWRLDRSARAAVRAVEICVVAQWLIGAVSLLLLVPVVLQLLHLLVADLVWLSVIWLGAASLAGQRARSAAPTSAAESGSNTVPAPSSR